MLCIRDFRRSRARGGYPKCTDTFALRSICIHRGGTPRPCTIRRHEVWRWACTGRWRSQRYDRRRMCTLDLIQMPDGRRTERSILRAGDGCSGIRCTVCESLQNTLHLRSMGSLSRHPNSCSRCPAQKRWSEQPVVPLTSSEMRVPFIIVYVTKKSGPPGKQFLSTSSFGYFYAGIVKHVACPTTLHATWALSFRV